MQSRIAQFCVFDVAGEEVIINHFRRAIFDLDQVAVAIHQRAGPEALAGIIILGSCGFLADRFIVLAEARLLAHYRLPN